NTTVVGECLRGRAVLRSGARPGDALFVTGRLGEAEFGLRLMENRKHRAAPGDRRTRKQLYPQPRLAIGAWLARKRLATAMMDLSDGLSSDLPRLCAASGVGARLEARKIPKPAHFRSPVEGCRALELALDGGDDYELLFAVAPGDVPRLPRRIAGTAITEIGRLVRQKEILLITEDRKEIPLVNKGWDPFRG
ncbi:MAG TPA: thiamine-phosphate kinase, partial [Candidatus Acidoferrum sp.]|nr:thiamine-phosphate kinase [Candidatus Acidoferrum sp.]